MWKYFAMTIFLIPLVVSDRRHISSDSSGVEYHGRGENYRTAVREDDLEKTGTNCEFFSGIFSILFSYCLLIFILFSLLQTVSSTFNSVVISFINDQILKMLLSITIVVAFADAIILWNVDASAFGLTSEKYVMEHGVNQFRVVDSFVFARKLMTITMDNE